MSRLSASGPRRASLRRRLRPRENAATLLRGARAAALALLALAALSLAAAENAAAQSVVLSGISLDVPEAGSASYTVKLATLPTAEVTVSIGGTSGTDLSLSRRSLTFTTSNWDTAQMVTVSAGGDSDATHDSATLTHTATGGDYGTVSADLAVTVTDTTRMRLVAVVERVSEGGSMQIRARLPIPLDDDVSITVTVAPNGGRADEYELSDNTTLTIAAGTTESTGNVVFTSLDDFTYTGVRYFAATLTPDHPRVDADIESFAVVDDDNTLTGWSVTPSTIFENGGEATLLAFKYRLHESVVKMTVSLEPSDRATLSGTTLTFQPGAFYATETLTITAVDNAADEPDQTITISATVTEGRSIRTPGPLQLTIVDDEGMSPEVALVLTPPLVREGLVSAVTAVASGPLSAEATITVSASPAHPDTRTDDYVLSANTVLTIPSGGTRSTGTVTIATVDGQLYGARRFFTVSGTVTGGGGVADPANQTLTILEDDQRVRVSLRATPATIAEGEVSTITMRSLQGPMPANVTVTLSEDSDAAELSADPVLMIAAGETESTGVVTLTAVDDDNMRNELVLVRLVPSTDNAFVRFNDPIFVYTLDDDTTRAWLTVSPVPAHVVEGETSKVIAHLSQPLSDDVTVTIGVDEAHVDHTVRADDYTLSANRTLTISAGEMRSTGDVTLESTNDEYYGPLFHRRVVLDIASVTGIDRNRVGKHSDWNIFEDEAVPRVTLEVTPASFSENGGQSTVTARLNTKVAKDKVAQAVEVTISAAPVGTTTASGDFTQIGTVLTIPAGEKASTGTVTISAVDDDVDGPDKNLVVTGTVDVVGMEESGLVWHPYAERLTIRDDDDATLSVNDVSGSEGGTLTFTVTLSVASEDTVGVTWTATAGGASDTADTGDLAGTLTGTLSFAPGDISKTFTVSTAEDTTDEADETFTVTLSGPTNATLADATGTGTIADDDGAPSLSVADAAAAEGSDVSFTVTLSAASGKTVTVSYDTSRPGGTTAEAADFTAQTNRTLTIPAGATTGTIAVPTANDTIDEADETFRLTLSSPTNATLADATATGTITDDDDATLSVNDVSGSEGGTLTFTVTLSVASEDTVGVTWTATAGGASDTADTGDLAGTLTGTLSFAPGDISKTFTVSTAEDTTDEADETFTVTLSGPTNATLADATGTGTIADDDGAPSLSVADAAAAEGSDVSFTVTLSAASGKTVTVSYDTSRPGGTTAEAADFTAQTNRTLTIPAGATTGTIAVPTANDTIDEADETFRLTLSSPTNATLADATATGTITDDDDATLSVNDVSGSEGGTLTFTVTLSVASEDTVGVTWTATAGGASDTADTGDLAGTLTGTLSFAPGDISKTFTVSTAEDTTDEADETFTVTLSGPTNATLADATGTGTIADDDGAPSLSVADAAAAEGSDVSFTVTLSAASGKTVTVSYDTSRPGGTTAEAADFTAQTNRTLTIPAGATTGTIAVPTANDTIDEADETFRLTLSSPTNATLADATATGTITDGDDATLSVNDVSGSEGGTLTFTVTLSVASEDTVGVTWTASAGGASDTADTGDLAGTLTGTLSFAPGDISKTFTVSTAEDTTDEADETFTVTLSGPTNATLADATGTGTIADDDGAPSLSVADAAAAEGSDVSFTVTLSAASGKTVTVSYDTSRPGGTTAEAADFTAQTNRTLTIPAGATTGTIAVPTANDTIDEADETFRLTLSSPTNATLADATATGTITDGDDATNDPKAWIARFGRTVAEQVLVAVEGRMRATPASGVEVALAGERIGGQAEPGSEAERDARREEEARRDAQRFADWLRGETDPEEAQRLTSRAVTPRDLLTGSSFALTAETDGKDLVSLWGRAAVTRFDGREGDLMLDGEVVTGMLGADWTRGRWTAGLIVSHSAGEGGYSGAPGAGDGAGNGPGAGTGPGSGSGASGRVEATLTGVFPWGRYALSDRLEAWGAAGYGQGELTVTPKRPGTDEDGAAIRAGLELGMAAAGLRGVLLDPESGSGFRLTGKIDAMVVQTASGRGRSADGGNLAPARATVTRLRLGLEGSRPILFDGGFTLTPSLEIGVRHDGGDAETGFGLDLGGGLALSDPKRGLQAELRGRGLLTHESKGFRDLGFSGSLAWEGNPGSDRGAKLRLTQTVGGSSSGGADALLARTTLEGLAANDDGAGGNDELKSRRLELKFGYGLSAFGDRFTWTPEVGVDLSDTGRDYSLGWRLVRGAGSGGGSLDLSFEATRRESANDDTPPVHEVGLRLTARF